MTLLESSSPCSASGVTAFTVSVAVCDVPEYVAVIVAIVEVFVVRIVKAALCDPAGTVIDAGTVTEAALLESVTATPFSGAATDSEIVPVTVAPPDTDADESVTPDSEAVVVVVVAAVGSVQRAVTRAERHTKKKRDAR